MGVSKSCLICIGKDGETVILGHQGTNHLFKVTVQFKTEGNGQNEIVSRMDESEVKL